MPKSTIYIDKDSKVRIETIGQKEDRVQAQVNDRKYNSNCDLYLMPGKNIVDFLVMGEGEVHYWHAKISIDGTTVFEHKQPRLPAFSCSDEIYRFRVHIYMKGYK